MASVSCHRPPAMTPTLATTISIPAYQHPDWLKKQRRKKPLGREDKQQKAASDTETIELMAEDITSSTQGIQQSNSGINAPELATSASSTHITTKARERMMPMQISSISLAMRMNALSSDRHLRRASPLMLRTRRYRSSLRLQSHHSTNPQASSFVTLGPFRFRELRCSGQSSKPQAQPFHSSLSYTTSTSLRPRVSFGSSIPDG